MTLRILLVEDDPGFAEAVTRAIEDMGHEVTWAKDDEAAYIRALEQPRYFDMAFVDFDLGGGKDTGDLVVQRLKSWNPEMFVVLWSGIDRDPCKEADAQLSKMHVATAMDLIDREARTREEA